MNKIKSFLLQNQTLRQTILKNTFWLFIGQVLGRLLRAIIIIYAARVLGAAQWGIFSYAMGVVAFLTIFTDLGINAILTKETARMDLEKAAKSRSEIISTSLFIKLAMICFSLFILFFIAPLFSNIKEAIALFPIMGLILIFDNLREFGFSITHALEKMEIEAWFYILTNILIVVLGFIFLNIKATPLFLAYSYVLGTGLGMLVTFIFLRNHFTGLWQNFSRKLIMPIFTSAWPFAMLGIMGGIMINTDIILLGWMRTAEELGFYSAAQKPVQAFYILPTLIATSLFPSLARLAKVNDAKAAEIIMNSLRLVLLIALPIVLTGIILGPDIVQLIFGAKYLPATISWQILIISLLIIFPSMILGNAIFAYDQQKLFIKLLAIGTFSNIFLDLIFIPLWGGPGSALATVIAQFLNGVFLWTNLKKINPEIKNPEVKILLTSAICTSASLLLMKFWGINFLINIIISGLLYLAILFRLKDSIWKSIKF